MTFKPFPRLNPCEFCSKENLPIYHPQRYVCYTRVQQLENRVVALEEANFVQGREELEKENKYCDYCHIMFGLSEKSVSHQGKFYHIQCYEVMLRRQKK